MQTITPYGVNDTDMIISLWSKKFTNDIEKELLKAQSEALAQIEELLKSDADY